MISHLPKKRGRNQGGLHEGHVGGGSGEEHGLDESTANGFNRSFLVVKDIMGNTVPPQPNPNEGDGSKELTLGDEIPPEESSRPGIYEVELSMRGVGAKETFSPTTFILYGILREALEGLEHRVP